MTLSTLIIIVVIGLILLIPFFRSLRWYAEGEDYVASVLESMESDGYLTVNDLTIMNNNRSAQIDHVVVSRFGLFVIETKAYKGWIFGSEEGQNWTQALYTEKHQFYNPILQNRGHVNALKFLLRDYPQVPYHSIIVMDGSCSFRTFDKVQTPVIYPGSLTRLIVKLSVEPVLSREEVLEIHHKLSSITHENMAFVRKTHIENVRKREEDAYLSLRIGQCPRCGGELVERQGKYGTFMGCRNYPKCKFTQNI